MKKRFVPVAMAALGLVLAACGGDDDDSTDATSAPVTQAPTTEGASDSTAAPTTEGGAPGTTAAPSDCTLDAPLKIGFAADLGELGAFSDQPGSEAAKVQVDLINEAGGVGGLPVEYEVKDIQGDPAATQRAAQELLDDGVNAIIGPPFASTGAPLIDAVAGKAPILFMASTDPSLADPSRGAFLTTFSDPVQAAAAAEYAAAQGKTTAVTFSSSDDVYFSGNPAYFTDAFEHGGGTVVKDFSFGLADSDFSTQVNELAGLDPMPEVLYTAMVMPQIGTLLEQMDGAGLGDMMVIGADAFDATEVWGAGPIAEGVFFTGHTFPSDSNGVQAFLDEATAAGAQIATVSFGALASDSVKILAAAATEACSTDAATLIDTIDNLVNVPVTTGTVSFKGTGGVPEKDVVILTVTDGAPAFVEALRPSYIPS
ncbi:MAG: ABC transporter substrate-binding protein [Ilumatobacteraceae bacterium]|jgi:branched-chain amino acid transport system substrate-binding protein